MQLPLCAKCESYMTFFVPEKQEINKFWHRCDECGVLNELVIDSASSGESKPVFKVIGIAS